MYLLIFTSEDSSSFVHPHARHVHAYAVPAHAANVHVMPAYVMHAHVIYAHVMHALVMHAHAVRSSVVHRMFYNGINRDMPTALRRKLPDFPRCSRLNVTCN
jgi:hypothetical protein